MKIKLAVFGAIFAILALLLFGLGYVYSKRYYSERDQIRARLESLPNVEILDISGRNDLLSFNVRHASIRLVDRPDSVIELEVPALGILQDSDYVLLSKIGCWELSSLGERFLETTDYETKKPIKVKQDYAYGNVNIGSAGPISSQLPFKIRNLQDVISHYSELESFFEKWPDQNFHGERVPRYENVVWFHIPDENE